MSHAAPRASAFDPLSESVRRCPHAQYPVLVREPVVALDGHPNFFLVSGYRAVREVLLDPHTYDGQPFPDQEVPVMSAMRPEPHARLRSAVQSLFTPRALEKLTPFIEREAVRRTDQLVAAGGGDVMELWARAGLPYTGLARHPQLVSQILRFQLEILDIFEAHLAEPRDEIIDALVPPYRRGDRDMAEILASAVQILVAGFETTANTLSASIHRFATRPEIFAALKEDPGRVERFVEETLRLDAPLQRTIRRTTRATTLAGVELPANAQLIVVLGAANLDPAVFPAPDRFDMERPEVRKHLTFGKGIHFCLGAQLARLEVRIALDALIARASRIELDPDHPPVRVTDKGVGLYGFERLPVIVTAEQDDLCADVR